MKRSVITIVVVLSFLFVSPVTAEVLVGINMVYNFGVGNSGTLPELASDWKSHFQPPGGSMKTDDVATFFTMGMELGTEVAYLTKNGWVIGIPCYWDIAGISSAKDQAFYFRSKSVSRITTRWWDEVTAAELVLKKPWPAMGLSVRKKQIKVTALCQPYETWVEDFEGVDCVGCENSSEDFRERFNAEGVGWKLMVAWLFEEYDTAFPVSIALGGYVENLGDIWVGGLSVEISMFKSFFRREEK